jgi:pyrroloquinoline quinone biosynthesis protein B
MSRSTKRFSRLSVLLALVALLAADATTIHAQDDAPYLVVLGIAQDGGRPHIACQKPCCTRPAAAGHRDLVSCLALVDPGRGQRWIFDATPDLPEQLRLLDRIAPRPIDPKSRDIGVQGIFLTHAHIGHYPGLMYLGREAMGAHDVPVYALPRMRKFLRTNGPWDQLVKLENIAIRDLEADRAVDLGAGITVTPWLVPHRDEYSETAAFLIRTRGGAALFLPDIDKWSRWERHLASVLGEVDYAFIDATFFSSDELPGRSLEEIPHPTIQETMQLLADLPVSERHKIRFIHLNHSNPAFDRQGEALGAIRQAGMDVAEEGAVYRFE